MMQVIPNSPRQEAINALENALVRARGEVTKLEQALALLRESQGLDQYQGLRGLQGLVGGAVGLQSHLNNT